MLFSMMTLDAYKVDPIKVLEAIVTARQRASEITVFFFMGIECNGRGVGRYYSLQNSEQFMNSRVKTLDKRLQ